MGRRAAPSPSEPLRAPVRRLTVEVIALLVAMGAASAANATPESIQVQLSAPAECPATASLIGRVRAILGAPPRPGASLLARVAIEAEPSGLYRARVHTHMAGVEGERELQGNTCEEVIDATALVLALLLGPNAEEREAQGEDDVNAPLPEPEPKQPTEVAASPPLHDASFAGHLRLALGAGYGTQPGTSAALWFAAGFSHQSAALELRAGAWLPKRASSATDPEIGGSFLLFDGAVALCVRPRFGFWRWDSCAGLDGAWIRAEGHGSTQTNAVHTTVAHGLMEQAVAFEVFRDARLRVAVQGLLPLGRPRFSVESVGEIHRPAAFALRGEVGLELQF